MLLQRCCTCTAHRAAAAVVQQQQQPWAAAAAAAVPRRLQTAAADSSGPQRACRWQHQHQHRQQQEQQWRRCATASPEAAAAAPAGDDGADAIYNQPQLYDDAFSYRDFPAEAKFLMGAFQRHADPGGKLATVLELGAGPANHAVQLAARGVRAWALDSNQAMLQFAAAKAAAAGVELATQQGDMAAFDVPGMAGKFDMVCCLLGTLSHLLDNRAAAAAFRCTTAHLRPGGLFVLELAHPGDLFDGSLLLPDTGAEMWEVNRGDGAPRLMVVWGDDADEFNPQTQVVRRSVAIHTLKEGDKLDACLLEQVVPYRQFTLQEVDLLASLAGLEVAAVYGDLDLAVDSLTHEEAFRLVVVLRKPGGSAADGGGGSSS